MATSSLEVLDDKQNHSACRVRGNRTPPSQDHRRESQPWACRYPAAWSNGGPAAATLAATVTVTRRSSTGPTWIWTRKVDNKTVTRTLDTTQADALRPLMDNSRRLRELTTELATLALQQVRDDPTQPDP